jgi:hypothetical protein
VLCCVSVFVFLRLLYPMLLVVLDSPFGVAPSVFSDVYLMQVVAFFYVNLHTYLLFLRCIRSFTPFSRRP